MSPEPSVDGWRFANGCFVPNSVWLSGDAVRDGDIWPLRGRLKRCSSFGARASSVPMTSWAVGVRICCFAEEGSDLGGLRVLEGSWVCFVYGGADDGVTGVFRVIVVFRFGLRFRLLSDASGLSLIDASALAMSWAVMNAVFL